MLQSKTYLYQLLKNWVFNDNLLLQNEPLTDLNVVNWLLEQDKITVNSPEGETQFYRIDTVDGSFFIYPDARTTGEYFFSPIQES